MNKKPSFYAYPFNIRVYGIWIENGNLIYTKEQYNLKKMVKFPGGGLQYGEGLIEALKREFKEEFNVEIAVNNHIYTTDFYVSSFVDQSQVIAVYYEINGTKKDYDELTQRRPINSNQNFQQIISKPIVEISEDIFTFDTDKHLFNLINAKHKR